jgi:hypothetical protein
VNGSYHEEGRANVIAAVTFTEKAAGELAAGASETEWRETRSGDAARA